MLKPVSYTHLDVYKRQDISVAVNAVRNSKGGIAVVDNGKIKALLELPVAAGRASGLNPRRIFKCGD